MILAYRKSTICYLTYLLFDHLVNIFSTQKLENYISQVRMYIVCALCMILFLTSKCLFLFLLCKVLCIVCIINYILMQNILIV